MKVKVNDPAFQYLLYCSKICGSGHYNMKKVVRVVSQAEYDAWVVKQPKFINNDLRKQFNLPLEAEPAAAAPAEAPADSTATPAKDSSAVAMNKPALKK